jgi:CDP-paratose 2-epimerase
MKWLITGGAGFIGCNAAARLAKDEHAVFVIDDLSRKGSDHNLEWLRASAKIDFARLDVRNAQAVGETVRAVKPDVVLHLAAQVAVTTSVADPRADFETNALGTFNVCEAARLWAPEAILLNASTNKVYGELTNARVIERDGRYAFADLEHGVSESRPLDFHSPYGCSKGAADQYVHDYHRIYGLRTVNFRQSCIYGYHQFGVEDQGWVAWFVIAALLGKPVTVYGDGKQVRDVLFVDDLIDCYQEAVAAIDRTAGQCFNIGGGPTNAISLLDLLGFLEKSTGKTISPRYETWRRGDQRVFVADIQHARDVFGWKPRTAAWAGVEKLARWADSDKELLAAVLGG